MGDLDGDGLPALVVGAPDSWEGGGAGSQGRVEIFAIGGAIGHDNKGGVCLYRSSEALVETGPFQTLLGETPVDQVGYGLIGPGDLDGDGYPDLAIGAPFQDTDGVERAGAVYFQFGTPPEPEPEPEDGGSDDGADGDSKGATGCCQASPGAPGLVMALASLLLLRRRRAA